MSFNTRSYRVDELGTGLDGSQTKPKCISDESGTGIPGAP